MNRRNFLASLLATPIAAALDIRRPSFLEAVAGVAIGVDHALVGTYRYVVTYVRPWPEGGPPDPNGTPGMMWTLPPGVNPEGAVRRVVRSRDTKSGAWW